MLSRRVLTSAGIVVALAFTLTRPFVIRPLLDKFAFSPPDDAIGTITLLSPEQLTGKYQDKNVLVIGGTRGVGYGVALTVAKAGAFVTIVGRSEKSGKIAVSKINEQVMQSASNDKIKFHQGDIGTIRSATALVESLSSQKVQYDYLIVTAATFPDWTKPLQQEDGLEQCYAIAVMGRYIIYKNIDQFVKPDGRVLNVLASGDQAISSKPLDRDLVLSKRNIQNLFESIQSFALSNEIMIAAISSPPKSFSPSVTMVSTHPGHLKTDLHRGQGWWFDIIEFIMVTLAGISEEECGINQASILASDKLRTGSLSYVDFLLNGRLRADTLQNQIDEHGDWLVSFLNTKLSQTREGNATQ